MTRSEQIGDLVAALAKAQGAFPNIPKDREASYRTRDGREITYRFCDLGTILRAVTPALSANELAFIQEASPEPELNIVRISSLIMHVSGQWIAGELCMRCTEWEPRSVGSSITYGRRYATSLLGISPVEDDDAEAVSRTEEPEPSSQSRTLPTSPPVTVSSPSVPNGETSGQLYVRQLKPGRAGGIAVLVLSDGRELLFYKPGIKGTAEAAMKRDQPIRLETKRSTSGNEYVVDLTLEPIAQAELGRETETEMLSREDIPF